MLVFLSKYNIISPLKNKGYGSQATAFKSIVMKFLQDHSLVFGYLPTCKNLRNKPTPTPITDIPIIEAVTGLAEQVLITDVKTVETPSKTPANVILITNFQY